MPSLPLALLAACLLALAAVPSWTTAGPVALEGAEVSATVDSRPVTATRTDDDDDKDDADDDDDDDEHEKKEVQRPETPEPKERKEGPEVNDLNRIEAQIREKLGPDMEKKIAALNEALERKLEAMAKDLEKKVGSDLVKRMEAMGKEMEAMGKQMEKKFGPGSDFEIEIEGKFGPDSEFVKRMESLHKEMEKKFGPGSDFVGKRLGVRSKPAIVNPKAKPEKPSSHEAGRREVRSDRQRSVRIKALEDAIRKLTDELKALKAEEDTEAPKAEGF